MTLHWSAWLVCTCEEVNPASISIWIIGAWSWSTMSKSFMWPCWRWLIFNPTALSRWLNVTSLVLLYHCLYSKFSDELHSLMPSIQTFRTKTHLAMSTGLIPFHSLCILLTRRSFFSQELLLCVTGSCIDSSLNTSVLTSSNPGSIIIDSIYSQSLPFVLPSLMPSWVRH